VIIGVVNARREATLRLPVRDASGQEQQIEVVLDTGFSGSLTLPPPIIVALGRPFRSRGSALLADGSQTEFDIHAATISWDGAPRNILVEVADTARWSAWACFTAMTSTFGPWTAAPSPSSA